MDARTGLVFVFESGSSTCGGALLGSAMGVGSFWLIGSRLNKLPKTASSSFLAAAIARAVSPASRAFLARARSRASLCSLQR